MQAPSEQQYFIASIERKLAPLRADLLNHRIYHGLNCIETMRLFMEHHVFAVWDFMLLLKVLQRRLCCVDIPWLPPVNPQACRFLNEIVLAEESDEDGQGSFASHFDLYRRAMVECGADTTAIDAFLAGLRQGTSLDTALEVPGVPPCSRRFVSQTWQTIQQGQLCEIASAFTFGREALLPDVFQRIVDELNASAGGQLQTFQYYLRRHIGLDGDEHGPMAERLLQSLCGDDRLLWVRAEQAAVQSLIARRELWDGMAEQILG